MRTQAGNGLDREEWLRLDGSPVDVATCAVRFEFEGEEGSLVFFADVSQQVRGENEKRLLEDQFRQAQKLESIGRLAGGVAHDFNNLLTLISGYTEMMLSDFASQPAMREPLEEVAKAAQRASDLTRQLLAFSRRQRSEPRRIVVGEALREFEKMLRRLIGEDVKLVLSLSSVPCAIHVDPGHFEQVIMNRAVNARDAMPPGGRLVSETSMVLVDESCAQAHAEMEPGSYVAVPDTGLGMSAEYSPGSLNPSSPRKRQEKALGWDSPPSTES